MGRSIIDITNQRYGRLVVQERVYPEGASVKHSYWLCLCDCGSTTITTRTNLIHGATRSCSCLMREVAKAKATTHQGSGTRLYGVWNGIKSRCYVKSAANYGWYGGREKPITMCDEWRYNFATFRDWALENGYDESASYKDLLTVERVNNDLGYSPENCTLVGWVDQQKNTRRSLPASSDLAKIKAMEKKILQRIMEE